MLQDQVKGDGDRMKRMMMVILAMAVLLTGCLEVYEIDPDGTETKVEIGTGKKEAVVEEKQEPEEKTEVKEEEAQPIEKVEPEKTEEELEAEKVEEMVETLFVTQFADDEPYDLDVAVADLSNEDAGWSFKRNSENAPVTGYYDVDITLFDAFFINTEAKDEKVMYLTFDEGYENGYTPAILDTLLANNVKATFFVTGHYINSQPELVQRMVDEGHHVANHSVNHPKFPTLTEEEIYDEITGLNEQFKELTGQDLSPFFRPPSGRYSERTLYLTRKLGYRTIFWSMAYNDWNPDNQETVEWTYDHVTGNAHNGAIILMHAVSESNTLALDDILKDLKAEGYRFGSLYELD